MRVITYSQFFPSYHPKASEPTWFVPKILRSLDLLYPSDKVLAKIGWIPKWHTIRAGNRWNPGDTFSARYWTGPPYRSKQEEFAKIEIKKVFPFQKVKGTIWVNHMLLDSQREKDLAINDGLTVDELKQWFQKDFTGQVICWGDVEYPR